MFGTVAFDLRGYAIFKCMPLEVEVQKGKEKYSDHEHTFGDCLSRCDHLAVDGTAPGPLPSGSGWAPGSWVHVHPWASSHLPLPCPPAQPPAGFP